MSILLMGMVLAVLEGTFEFCMAIGRKLANGIEYMMFKRKLRRRRMGYRAMSRYWYKKESIFNKFITPN